MPDFATHAEKMAYADQRLKEGVKPKELAAELGYKNAASFMAIVRDYRQPRGVKSGINDADAKPEMPDFIREAMSRKNAPVPQPLAPAPVELPPLEDLDLPTVGTVIPQGFRVTGLDTGFASYLRMPDGPMAIVLRDGTYTRDQALALAQEIADAADVLLPEVPNDPA